MSYTTNWTDAANFRNTVGVHTAAAANSELSPDEPVAAGHHALVFDFDGGAGAVIEGTRADLRAAMVEAIARIDAAADNDPAYRPELDLNYC